MHEKIGDANAMAFGAYRRAGLPDTYNHSNAVRMSMRAIGPILEVVALLHDVVEDTDVTLDDVRCEFGDTVANAVDALTRREGESYHREYLPRVRSNPFAWIVKAIGDVPHNKARPRAPGWSEKRLASMQRRYDRALEELRF